MNKTLYYVLLIFFLCTAIASANSAHQSHDDIRATVQHFLNTQLTKNQNFEIKTQISKIDRRLKLAKCDQALTAFVNNKKNFQSRISVGVKCEGLKPWSLFIPVKIQRFASVYVAAHSIAKGEQITANDIQTVSRDISNLRGSYYKTKENILGKLSKRNIRPGAVFKTRHLALPIVVKKGDLVNIVAETRGLRIRMSGKAMTAGVKGQQIRVKNLSSKRTIQAVVQHSGLVKIIL